jgi:hypothetical protein
LEKKLKKLMLKQMNKNDLRIKLDDEEEDDTNYTNNKDKNYKTKNKFNPYNLMDSQSVEL